MQLQMAVVVAPRRVPKFSARPSRWPLLLSPCFHARPRHRLAAAMRAMSGSAALAGRTWKAKVLISSLRSGLCQAGAPPCALSVPGAVEHRGLRSLPVCEPLVDALDPNPVALERGEQRLAAGRG